MIKIESLHIYPIKSLAGISLRESKVTNRGLAYDRRWMLVDEKNQFISQREHPRLSLLQPEIKNQEMFVHDRSGVKESLAFKLNEPNSEPEQVTIWDDTIPAKPLSDTVNQWFSAYLQASVRLFHMHEESIRQADQRYAMTANDKVSFADGYPVLLLSEATLNLLNSKLESPLSMDRFRPNVVVSGTTPHEEDTWREINTKKQKLFGVKPCARCTITTIDQDSAKFGKEPLKTLATYRKTGNKVLFGENFIPKEEGMLGVGDEIQIIEKKVPAIA